MSNTPSKSKSKNRPLPPGYAAPPNPDPNEEFFYLDTKTLTLHPFKNPITGVLPKMPKYNSGFISSGYESGGEGRKRNERALKAIRAEFKAQHKAAREAAIAAGRGGNSGGPSHSGGFPSPGAFARGGFRGRGIGRGGMMHVPPGGPGMNLQGFHIPKLNTGRGQVLPRMPHLGMLPNMSNMNFTGQHMRQQFEQSAPEPQQGLFGNAHSGDEEHDSSNFNQGNLNNSGQQHQHNDSNPIWAAKKGKGPLDGWGEDNIAAPKQPPAGGHFGEEQGRGRGSTTSQGGGNFGSLNGRGRTYSTRAGGGGNGSQQKGSQYAGNQPAPVPQDTDDLLWHAQNAQYQRHRQSGQAQDQPQNQRQPSPAPTVQSTYQTSFSTDRAVQPNPPPQHEREHQHQQQASPALSKSQTNPFPTPIHPKGDDRWPPPGSSVNRPIYLLEKYWYQLLYNNPAPEVSQLRKETITRVTSAWQKYKKEQKPKDDPRLFMIWAKNTSKMKEISKGSRGDVYLLKQDHEYVAGCALAVEGWEKEREKKNTNFGVGNTRWRILGVGEKEYRGCLLLVKENLK